MPRSLTMFFLIMPLISMIMAAGAFVSFLSSWRRSFGAQSGVTSGAVVMFAVAALLHAGYILAPFLFAQSRSSLALKLTLPLAAIATIAIVGFLIAASTSLRADAGEGFLGFTWMFWGAMGLLVAYWLPVASLLSHH